MPNERLVKASELAALSNRKLKSINSFISFNRLPKPCAGGPGRGKGYLWKAETLKKWEEDIVASFCKCEMCGTGYQKKHKTHRFCCKKCSAKHRRKSKQKSHVAKVITCKYCRNEFAQKKSNSAFCSLKCGKKYEKDKWSKIRVARESWENRRTIRLRYCRHCGTPFFVNYKQKKNKVCGKNCRPSSGVDYKRERGRIAYHRNKEKISDRQRQYWEKQREVVSDVYVRKQIRKRFSISIGLIPDSLVQAEKLRILIKRKCNEG